MIRQSLGSAALQIGSLLRANAAEFTVKILNSGPGGMMVFDPATEKIQPGDTIQFVPADRGHNAELIKRMAPGRAPTFRTVVGKEETVTFDKASLYGFTCPPHDIMGMVGLIQVGDKPENPEVAKAIQHGKLAAKRFGPLSETVQ